MEDQAGWPAHAAFMDGLLESGFIVLGGPLEGEREAFHVVDAPSEQELRARFAQDPWAQNGMLTVTSVERWVILLAPEE